MSKALCSARGVTTKKIVDISETILAALSKIPIGWNEASEIVVKICKLF